MFHRLLNFLRPKPQPHADDFIKRIRSLVIGEGMLREGNIHLLEYAIQNMPPEGCVVEIGSYGGLSTNLIIHLLKKYHKPHLFFNCDAWIYEGYKDDDGGKNEYIDGRTDVFRTHYSVYMKEAFMHATRLLSASRLPHSFHLHSHLFFDKWQGRETDTDLFGRAVQLGGDISFAYIDGGHSLDIAWSDFTNVAAHLVKNGYILLDDSADHLHFGSAQMMSTIKKDVRFRVVAKNPNYLIQRVQ